MSSPCTQPRKLTRHGELERRLGFFLPRGSDAYYEFHQFCEAVDDSIAIEILDQKGESLWPPRGRARPWLVHGGRNDFYPRDLFWQRDREEIRMIVVSLIKFKARISQIDTTATATRQSEDDVDPSAKRQSEHGFDHSAKRQQTVKFRRLEARSSGADTAVEPQIIARANDLFGRD
ncbi:hypothetical protein BST61_g10258 [Cercospora zeina]